MPNITDAYDEVITLITALDIGAVYPFPPRDLDKPASVVIFLAPPGFEDAWEVGYGTRTYALRIRVLRYLAEDPKGAGLAVLAAAEAIADEINDHTLLQGEARQVGPCAFTEVAAVPWPPTSDVYYADTVGTIPIEINLPAAGGP